MKGYKIFLNYFLNIFQSASIFQPTPSRSPSMRCTTRAAPPTAPSTAAASPTGWARTCCRRPSPALGPFRRSGSSRIRDTPLSGIKFLGSSVDTTLHVAAQHTTYKNWHFLFERKVFDLLYLHNTHLFINLSYLSCDEPFFPPLCCSFPTNDLLCFRAAVPCSEQSIGVACLTLQLETKVHEVFTITEEAPTRSSSWLEAPTSTVEFKNLLRHNAKHALTNWNWNWNANTNIWRD